MENDWNINPPDTDGETITVTGLYRSASSLIYIPFTCCDFSKNINKRVEIEQGCVRNDEKYTYPMIQVVRKISYEYKKRLKSNNIRSL